MKEIEERFKKGNDSFASYHVKCAANDLCVAWAHMKITEIEKSEINELIYKLTNMAEKLEREGN